MELPKVLRISKCEGSICIKKILFLIEPFEILKRISDLFNGLIINILTI